MPDPKDNKKVVEEFGQTVDTSVTKQETTASAESNENSSAGNGMPRMRIYLGEW
jgi:hypothetical protein